MFDVEKSSIGIIGLGYVGLPLAVEFGKHLPTVGFDINSLRINELKSGQDCSLEIDSEKLIQAKQLSYADNVADLSQCNVLIVTVPTPIDAYNRPDLSPLEHACKNIGDILKPSDIVIFESTVYPGATEELCVPILETQSKLKFNDHFFIGYSPERINPGDKERGLADVMKITSGSTPEIADFVDGLYSKIITAGTHKASSIKVAEAAKVIENTQRDLNIALVNELALIFNRLDIDTLEVLEAAGTKWNFLPFRPGLVGGHCIGVDPYYLTHKAQETGYHPEVILAGRRINDGMGSYIADTVIKLMLKKQIHISKANILILGLTFKENCTDLRNTRVVDIVSEFKPYASNIDIYDPWVRPENAKAEYEITTINHLQEGKYDAIILAVPHKEFIELGVDKVRALGKCNCILFDVKSVFPLNKVDGRL